MPLYEYECAECHRRTEKIQKFSDPELTICPFCGGPLARTITAPAIQFKGAGWYKDLYSSAKPTPAAGSGEGAAAGSNASGEGSATPKSESKSESGAQSGAQSGAKSEAAPSAAPAAPASTTPSSSGPSTR